MFGIEPVFRFKRSTLSIFIQPFTGFTTIDYEDNEILPSEPCGQRMKILQAHGSDINREVSNNDQLDDKMHKMVRSI